MIEPKITLCENPKQEFENGEITNYMFRMYRKEFGGWYFNSIRPVETVGSLQPSGRVWALTVFECVRITLDKDGRLCLLLAKEHIARLNEKAQSMSLPTVDEDEVMLALKQLADLERGLVTKDSFLIARLCISADDTAICKKDITDTEFSIVLEYRACESLEPLLVQVVGDCPVTKLVQGTAHTAMCARFGWISAKKKDYDETLWLDSVYNKYLLGLGMGTLFVKIGDEVVCPDSDDVLTLSLISLMESWGIACAVRPLSVDELVSEYAKGNIAEAFVPGDADLVRPVSLIDVSGRLLELASGKLSKKLSDSLHNIESGVLLSPAVKTVRV